jgi:hypothetical protein
MLAPTTIPGFGSPRRALVLFGGEPQLAWLRALKPGFRHCAAVLQCGAVWVIYNPMSNATEVATLPACGEGTLAARLGAAGYRVVATDVAAPWPVPLPWRPFTCVEAVKRAIGLRAPAVLTPWQLYRRLTAENGETARTKEEDPGWAAMSGG